VVAAAIQRGIRPRPAQVSAHEPDFGVLESRGCLACHNLEKDRPYLKNYEQGNPQSFVSTFGDVKKTSAKPATPAA
jgi:hypothetical protein